MAKKTIILFIPNELIDNLLTHAHTLMHKHTKRTYTHVYLVHLDKCQQ